MLENQYRTREELAAMLRKAREQAEMTAEDVAEMVRRERNATITAAQVHEAENPHEQWPGRLDHIRADVASVMLGGDWQVKTVFEDASGLSQE